MQQTPIVAHGFNPQSYYRQPVSNLRRINEIVSKGKNEVQQNDNHTTTLLSSIPNQESLSENMNQENQRNVTVKDIRRQHVGLRKDSKEVKNILKKSVVHDQENQLVQTIPGTNKIDNVIKRQSRATNATSNLNQGRPLTRHMSAENKHTTGHNPTQQLAQLSTSRSAGNVLNCIQRERKGHTMAPSARILAPIDSVKSNMFANIAAPSDSQAMKSSRLAQTATNNNTENPYSQGPVGMNGAVHDQNGEEDDDYEDDDSSSPIIVTVRYDPDVGLPPSEDVVRQAVNNKITAQNSKNSLREPIVLDFINQNTRPREPQMPISGQQIYFSQPAINGSTSANHPSARSLNPPVQQQLNLQSLQRLKQQQLLQQQHKEQQLSQQLLQQQRQLQLQRQQSLPEQKERSQLQQQQEWYQQFEQQEKQYQQQQQQQQQQQERQIQQQNLQLKRQLYLIEQKERAQLQQQQEFYQKLEQQEKQYQQQQKFQLQKQQYLLEQKKRAQLQQQQRQQQQQQGLYQQFEQEEKQYQQQQLGPYQQFEQEDKQYQQQQQGSYQQFEQEEKQYQQQQQRQIQQQKLQLQRQEQLKTFQQQLLQQQQQQKQQLQQFLQRQLQHKQQQQFNGGEQQILKHQYPQLFQQQQLVHQQNQRKASLPPIVPRTTRNLPFVRSNVTNQPPSIFLETSNVHPVRPKPIMPVVYKTPDQVSNINIQRLPYRNLSSTTPINSSQTGVDLFNNYGRKYTQSLFIPINFGMPANHQAMPIHNNSNISNIPSHLLQRPHTAPASSEFFRPPSALDIPELSRENLRDILNDIPDLHGCRFHIEYLESHQPDGYPLPLLEDHANEQYPVPVIVDELPKNIIQHVRSSNNLALKAALDPLIQPEQNTQSFKQSQSIVPVFNRSSSSSKTILHHSARPKHKVQRARSISSDSSDSFSGASVSKIETKTVENEIIRRLRW